jgi:hypothetical protein
MMVVVPVVGKVGDRITSYFDDFGELDGLITDVASGNVLLELAMTESMREKFASKLTWLEKKQKNPSIRDGRKQARVVPASPHSTLTSPMAAPRAALSSTCRRPVPLSRLACSLRSECRSPLGPALVAWSDFYPMASQSSSSNNRNQKTLSGSSCAPRVRGAPAVQHRRS